VFSIRKLFIPLALALAVATAFGCGRMPTAPAAADPAVSTSSQRVAQSDGLIGDVVGGLLKLVFRVLNVVGSIGGTLTNGRWTVNIPPDAIGGNATVSLGTASSTSTGCQLEIQPLSLNHFSRPVMLVADCRDVPDYKLRTYVMYWFNPSTGQWVQVSGSTVNMTSRTVTAPLQHFSAYSVGPAGGKAGW